MSIIFNGATCYAVGNAHLSLVAGKLRVSNIGTSGLDGIMVTVPQLTIGRQISIEHQQFFINNDGSVTVSYLFRNKDGNIVTKSENYEFKNQGNLKYGYNAALISPNSYRAKGSLNNTNVFDEEIQNDYNPPPAPEEPVRFLSYLYYAVKIALLVYDKIFGPPAPVTKEEYKETTCVNSDGSYCTTTSWSKDPLPIDMQLIPNQTTYEIDTWGIEEELIIPASAQFQISDFPKLAAVIFYVKGISEFEINAINISPVTIINQ